jgi:hypothetical protein
VSRARALLGLLAAGALASACGSGSTPVAGPVLDGGTAQGTTAMAVLAMGHLSDPANTFYETFSATSGSSWALTTPKGAATNGGIVVSSPTRGGGAVLSYLNLRFAAGFALADGLQQGQGEVLPALAAGPSSLAVSTATGQVAALGADGRVYEASSLSGPFRVVITEAQLAAERTGSCRLSRLTAVAFGVGGGLALGGSCTAQGSSAVSSGVFVDSGQSATVGQAEVPSFLPVSGQLGTGPQTVLRMDPGGAGVIALVAQGGNDPELRLVSAGSASSSGAAAPVGAVSAPASLAGLQIMATAGEQLGGGAAAELVTTSGPHGVAATLFAGSAAGRPRVFGSLPADVRVVVGEPDGSLAALAVIHDSRVEVYHLVANRWQPSQALDVQIPYGSSS